MGKEIGHITGIAVRGYKSIRDKQAIEIRPLTILAGANSSGKSSIMQPLLLLKQTLETPYDPGPLLLDGPNVRVTSVDQLLTRVPGRAPATTFAVELKRGERTLELTFGKGKGASLDVLSMRYSDPEGEFLATREMTDDEIRPLLPKSLRGLALRPGANGKRKGSWVVERDRCFLTFACRWPAPHLKGGFLSALRISPTGPFASIIEGAIHLPGLRGNPERTYKRTAVGPKLPGTFDAYAASVIYNWEATRDRALTKLGKTLEGLGLTWKVKAKPVDDTHVELRVGRLAQARRGGASDLVNIADVGFGVSQSLPVVVALLAARRDQLVYLEEPEIHLHPRAQRRMAAILADAAKRGVIVVAETHSSLVVREIQTLVAKGELRSKDVKLHWFTRDATDGTTKVTSADLDQNGAYGGWPEDFDDVALASEKDYLDVVEGRGAANE